MMTEVILGRDFARFSRFSCQNRQKNKPARHKNRTYRNNVAFLKFRRAANRCYEHISYKGNNFSDQKLCCSGHFGVYFALACVFFGRVFHPNPTPDHLI